MPVALQANRSDRHFAITSKQTQFTSYVFMPCGGRAGEPLTAQKIITAFETVSEVIFAVDV